MGTSDRVCLCACVGEYVWGGKRQTGLGWGGGRADNFADILIL